MSVSKAYS